MKLYEKVSESGDNASRIKDSGSVSVANSHRRFPGHKRINSELSEPLTSDELVGGGSIDPYFVFRNDLQNKLELADEYLADFLRIVHETDIAVESIRYKDSKKKLKRHLKSAESTLSDVLKTVQAVENNRDNFPHIDNSQLFERKSLVETSRSRIQKGKNEINSETLKRKLIEDERNMAVDTFGDDFLGSKNMKERKNSDILLYNQSRTTMSIQEQDKTLDELGDAVIKVGEMAENINEEISHQKKMLDDLDYDMKNAEEELGLVMGKLAKFMGTKDRWQLRTIIILTLIVIIMFFLVIYS